MRKRVRQSARSERGRVETLPSGLLGSHFRASPGRPARFIPDKEWLEMPACGQLGWYLEVRFAPMDGVLLFFILFRLIQN